MFDEKNTKKVFNIKKYLIRDSNSYTFRPTFLRRGCLPIPTMRHYVLQEGIEPSRFSAQNFKSCVATSYTTGVFEDKICPFLWEQQDSNLPPMRVTRFTVQRLTNSSITPICGKCRNRTLSLLTAPRFKRGCPPLDATFRIISIHI